MESTLYQSESVMFVIFLLLGMRIDFRKQKDSDVAEIMVNCSCWKDIEESLQGILLIYSCDVEEYVKMHLGDVVRSSTVRNVNLCLHISKADYQKGGSVCSESLLFSRSLSEEGCIPPRLHLVSSLLQVPESSAVRDHFFALPEDHEFLLA